MRDSRRGTVVWAGALFFATMCASRPPQLTLDEKIGQLFSYGAHGVFMSESSPAYRELMHQVRDNHIGGVIWFQSNVYETALLDQRLARASKVPLLVSADLEAGMGMRFLDTTFWPSAMAIAATGDPSLAEREGRVVAQEARTVGVNQILAPVADVNVDPDNPVINTRSFGEDPADVSRYVTAFIRGVQSEHVIATAKHFPGHGDTHVDSHRALPVLDVSRERLERVELVPFRAAIAGGVKSVMIGHLSVPSIDPTPAPVRADVHDENPYGTTAAEVTRGGTLPATVSPKIIEGLLRGELGFKGLVVSDAFDMGGLTEHFDAGEAAVRAVEAGEDQILLSPDTDAAVAAVKAAVKSGRIREARIDESVRRILDAKEFAATPMPDPDNVFRVLDSQEHRDLADEIARRALTLVRDGDALPLRRESVISLIIVNDSSDAGVMADLERELRARANVEQTIQIDPRTRDDELPEITGDVAVIAFAVRARSGAGSISVPEVARRLVERIRIPMIGISFGTPYLLREVPNVGTYICAYGIQPVMQVAAARALLGEAKFEGRLPVTIPGLYARGQGIVR
ncbi:MAG TPA: glycoside hydrolase family 3 protein [Thermoanaerobaculia bacterium]|nr:glycoside hydrolase family 3 protein [Thermoanaerobaculia bacterium]